MDHKSNECGEWELFIRFSDQSNGIVKNTGELPNVGDVLETLPRSVGIPREGKDGPAKMYGIFCNPNRPLVVTKVYEEPKKKQATVYVDFADDSDEKKKGPK
jgi:hypothetical protein